MIKDNPTKHMDAFQNLTINTLQHSYTFVYCTIEPPKNTDNGWHKMKCFSTLPKYLNLSSHEGCTITMWTEARVLRHAFSFLGKEFLSTINKSLEAYPPVTCAQDWQCLNFLCFSLSFGTLVKRLSFSE